MNKRLIMGAAGGCAVLAAVAAAKCRECKPRAGMWDRMRAGIDEMPKDFPPRVMFDNVEATRANTEHILDLLHAQRWVEDSSTALEQTAARDTTPVA